MDLNMPGLDGRALLSKVKSHDQLKSIPVAILTTSDDPADVQECYRNGANTFVQKPMSWKLFSSKMQALKSFWFEAAALPFQP
jgi:CheY-like chemotaxis protein